MNDWQEAMTAHRAAVEQVEASIRAVPAAMWTRAPAPGKWSPAEVVRHLVLVYQHLAAEQAGTVQIRVLPPPWKAWLLRTVALPRLLAGRPLPAGVRSPREARPSGELPSPDVALGEFAAAVAAWADAMERNRSRRGARATHPFFGRLPLLTMVRFSTIHTEHHRRQLDRAAAGLPLRDG